MFGRKKKAQDGLGGRRVVPMVGTVDPTRARAFYAGTLGLRLVGEDQFALVFDLEGTRLRVSVVPEVRPAGYTVLGWAVPDIRLAVGDLVRRGVTFLHFEGMTQDPDGVWTAPGGAKVAWFRDPDGNTLSITQFSGPAI